MRVEAGLYTLVALGAAGWADLANAPPDVIRLLAATAGTLAGAFVAAVAFQNIRGSERVWRGLASMSVGLLIAPWASAYIPRPDSIGIIEHAFSASGIGAFFGWWLVRAAQIRAQSAAENLVNRAADKLGLPRKRPTKKGDGRASITVLVLIAGLAMLVYWLRDLIGLLWAIATGWAGH